MVWILFSSLYMYLQYNHQSILTCCHTNLKSQIPVLYQSSCTKTFRKLLSILYVCWKVGAQMKLLKSILSLCYMSYSLAPIGNQKSLRQHVIEIWIWHTLPGSWDLNSWHWYWSSRQVTSLGFLTCLSK